MAHSFSLLVALSLLLGIFYFSQLFVFFPQIDSQVKFATDKKIYVTVDKNIETIKGVPEQILSFNTLGNCRFPFYVNVICSQQVSDPSYSFPNAYCFFTLC